MITTAPVAQASDCVIFLHGLARSRASMNKMADAFEKSGYEVVNVGYPSRKYPIEELSQRAVREGLEKCTHGTVVHFVTHSLGGILLRYYLKNYEIENLGRVVMMAPPNKGSAVVDALSRVPGFKVLNGPAGLQLGTKEGSIPLTLGPVDYEVGIVAGTRTFNPFLSQYLSNPDDGKVSVENTKVEGMTDFITVQKSHPFIMKSSEVIVQALSFIKSGRFLHHEQRK